MVSDELGVATRRRMTSQLLIGVPLLVMTALIVAKLPPWLVKRAVETSDRCLSDARKRHAAPTSCTPGLAFSIARLSPTVRAEAREIGDDIARRQASIVFDNAMANHPNLVERDAAATRRLASAGDDLALHQVADAGAFTPLADIDASDSDEPAYAAVAIGDLVKARARLPRMTPRGYDAARRTGALECLLGERERGLSFLRAAAESFERLVPLDSSARFAAQHCGGTFATLGFEPFVVEWYRANSALLSRAFDPKFQLGRRASIGRLLLRNIGNTQAALGLAAGSDFGPSPTELLDLIAGDETHIDLNAMFSVTPWEVGSTAGSDNFVDYAPPAWFERAAERYARAVERVAPLVDDRAARQAAKESPRETLRAGAVFAYLRAAGYRIRRGDRPGARIALAHARALDPGALARAPLELAAGDPIAALATLDAWQQGRRDERDSRAIADVNRILALEATGEHAKAHVVAKRLKGRAAEWLLLATALTSGAPLAGLVPGPTKEPEHSIAADMLAAIESKSGVGEIGYLSPDDMLVCPAVMVVIARAAEAAGDNAEVELDRVFASKMPSRTIALARAEAARWRNDPETAKRWQARADEIASLLVDDDAVVLAGIAGLW